MERITLYLCLLAVAFSTTYATLRMDPLKGVLIVLEGDRLELKCIHQYQKDLSPNSLFFYKDEELLNGVGDPVKTHPTLNNTLWEDTYKYVKEKTTMADSGMYKCKLENEASTSNIEVYILSMPVTEGAQLVDGAQSVTLKCGIDEGKYPYTISWTRNGEELEEGTKYNFANNSLEIMNPKRADMGEYQCEVTFFPDKTNDKHTIRPFAIAVSAPPNIDSNDNNKNMVQGDDLELKCKVSGYPKPEVNWLKDGLKINKTDRTLLKEYEGVNNSKLIIYSLVYEDEGMYTCRASNVIEGAQYNVTADMRLRVKDKLAALWPFLGIVAEVIILCAIILCYEKSRSKKLSDEDDAADGNVENTVDHGDVRHRRT